MFAFMSFCRAPNKIIKSSAQWRKFDKEMENMKHCTSGLELKIQRGNAIKKRGSFRKRVKGFGPLGALKAIQKGQRYSNHSFFLWGTQRANVKARNGKGTYILASSVWLFGGASMPFLSASEGHGLGSIRVLLGTELLKNKLTENYRLYRIKGSRIRHLNALWKAHWSLLSGQMICKLCM